MKVWVSPCLMTAPQMVPSQNNYVESAMLQETIRNDDF